MKQKINPAFQPRFIQHFTFLGFSFELLAAATVLSFAILSSCGKESLEVPAPSLNYFPTEKGKYVIYDVDSIVHSTDDNENDDSVYFYHYQVKEIIDTPFTDGEGKERQVVVRYYRTDSTQEWSFNIVWSQSLTNTSAYRWEDNIPYHKLGFPISGEIEWNGNDKNTLEEEMYHYKNIHASKTYNNIAFDSTLTVIQRDDNNFVEKIYGAEVYASGIGMIYKERDDLRKTSGIIVSGTEFKMVVNSYGN
ncbi:hypothetical protein BH11BAC1_BH11BAC1_18530 [soil metagenome]